MDKVDKETRSRIMAGIKGKDTKPELLIRRFLFKSGFRYRIHAKNLAGKPDLVLSKYKLVIFVHGCFWHRHEGCKLAYVPKSHVMQWLRKFSDNVRRDTNQIQLLMSLGWNVLIIWECGLQKKEIALEWLPDYIRQGPCEYREWPILGQDTLINNL